MPRPEEREASRRWPVWGGLGVLILLALALALPILDNGYSLDDYNWLERAEFRDSNVSFLLEPEPGQIFSPVGRGFFLLLHALAGMNPLPYRLAVLALHLLNIALLYFVVERVFERPEPAFVSAFLFTVATSYDEVLFWIAALFHPLTATLCLATLLGFVVYLERGSRACLLGSLLAYGAALFCKAPAYPFFLVLVAAAALLGKRRRDRWRALAPFVATLAAALGLNLLQGLQHSYLLERGYYQLGSHLASNLAVFFAWIALPWEAAATRLGAESFYGACRAGLEILLPIAAVAVLIRGTARVRFFLFFGLATLSPFLPFVFEPASRYTYLAALGFAPVVAAGLLATGRWLRSLRSLRWLRYHPPKQLRAVFVGLGAVALALLSFADTMVRDDIYEHREQVMVRWTEDVLKELPELPSPPVVRIAEFPLLGIDRGIHFEAALRLAYTEPALRLETLAPSETKDAGAVLSYEEGRIKRAR